MGRKRTNLDAIAQLARECDIVGLQESDPGSLRSGFTNQTHYLAQRAGFLYWTHQPNRRIAGVACSANGLLSRLKPRGIQEHALPGRMGGRGVLLAKFGNGPDSLVVAVAHLSLGVHSRMAQLLFIADLLAEHPNAILMGDFNCMADCPEMQVLYHRTRLQPPGVVIPTFPSWRPQRAIDHILVSQGLHICKAEAIQTAFSDHLALGMEIVIPQGIVS